VCSKLTVLSTWVTGLDSQLLRLMAHVGPSAHYWNELLQFLTDRYKWNLAVKLLVDHYVWKELIIYVFCW